MNWVMAFKVVSLLIASQCMGNASAKPYEAFHPDQFVLSQSERDAIRGSYMSEMSGRKFELRDANGDKAIDSEEWLSAEWAYLMRFDIGRDGILSRAEYLTAQAPMNPDGSPSLSLKRIDDGFRNMDANKDEQLTKEELRGSAMNLFRMNDRCRHGKLTPEEYGENRLANPRCGRRLAL